MRWIAVLAALTASVGYPASCAAGSPAPPVAELADVFPAIAEVRSRNGVARVALDVIVDPSTGYPAFVWQNHVGEAPTIRVAPGDTIELTVHDAMRRFQGRPNDVNVHFHGLTVSPDAPGDDALMTLAHPGQTLQYRVHIPPGHEPGLYWYHPHVHGASYYDVTNGMAGAIVVEGMQRHLPALAAMRERIIVLRDIPAGPGFVDDDMPVTGTVATGGRPRGLRRTAPGPACRPETGLRPTLNRQADAHIAIRPGESQFFRVVNASAARYFDLSVDGAPLVLVARDGVPLDAYPGAAPAQPVRHVLLPPASRAEFVLTAPAHDTVLRSACVDTGAAGDAAPPVLLAHLVDAATGTPVAATVAARHDLRVGAPLPRNLLSQPLPKPAVRRTIRLSEDARGFYIDGTAFAMERPPAIVARSGTIEEWTVENVSDEVHDFHVHQVHFVTAAIDGIAVTARHWSDTADVPPRRRRRDGTFVPGRVRLLVDFRDPVVRGTFVFHCHILDHEDQGMMATVRVR